MALFQSTLPAKGSDCSPLACRLTRCNFNPRFPRREATPNSPVSILTSDFNPRFPRREATFKVYTFTTAAGISIHASREGKRPYAVAQLGVALEFQSTLPAKGSDFPSRPC